MTYRYIPIRDSDDLTLEATTELHRALTVWSDERVVVHCSTGNRAGALFALRAFYFQRATIDEAIEMGRSAGLTTLEPAVRQKLFERADSISGS